MKSIHKKIFIFVLLLLAAFAGRSFWADPSDSIRFSSHSVEPFKIKVGETQTTRVSIESDNAIKKVTAQIPFEGGSDEISLSRISGDDRNGTWEGKWICHNTLTKEYKTRIKATDSEGNTKEIEEIWWDDTETIWLQGWDGRERVVLTENTGSSQTNLKTQITLTYKDEMQADFDDIRFTSADGNTLLGYYLDSKVDSSTATYWVTVPSLTASADTSIYYYFGNLAATSLSDIANAPAAGDSIYYWSETSGTDFADGTFSNSLVFGSGTDGYVGLGPGSGLYAFEKAITVTNSTASALTDYQVKLTLDTASLIAAGKMQGDCDDMRFYESDRSTSVPFYLDSGCNTATTLVYLNTDLSASASKTVYFYYGNSGVASASSGANTFMLYDDLESGAVDETTKWDIRDGVLAATIGIRTDYKYAGTYSVGSNQAGAQGGGIAVYDQMHFLTKTPLASFPVGSTIVWKGYVYRYKTTTWGGHFGGFGVGGTSTDTTSEISDVPSDAWYTYEWYITRTATDGWEFIEYRNGAYNNTYTRTKTFTTNFLFGIQTRHNNASDNSIYMRGDNVSIRKYTENEPTCSVGEESMRSFTYTTSGTYISHTLDVGAQSKFDSLDITVTAPTNTTIKFQLAANNDNATWSYVGPAGTGSDYYTADSTTFSSAIQGKRFLRYKVYLDSTDSSATPQCNSISIGYINVSSAWAETSTTDFSDGTFVNTAANNGALELATGAGIDWVGSTWNFDTPDSGATQEYPAPALADLDNDGDLDAMIGNVGGITYAYENTGSATAPIWTAKPSWNTPNSGTFSMPALADLDNDGDYDLMIGDNTGFVYGYKNTGSASSPTWTAFSGWNTVDVGGSAAPSLVDLDNDGDYDLMIGESAGVVKAYKNTGSASSPTWTAEATWNSPDVGVTSAPTFYDLDNDGDFDLLSGSELGLVYAYKNTGTASSPAWSVFSYWNGPQGNMYSTPCLGDLNNDGYGDLILGGRENAYLQIYENDYTTFYGTSGDYTTPAGTYISSSLDIGTTGKFDSLFFHTTTPTNTTAKFQIAVNNDNSTWNFIGPDDTVSTYYDAMNDIPATRLLGYRYMRYKAYLETSSVVTTPSVQDVSINYTKVWQQTTTADFSGGTLTDAVAGSDSLYLSNTGSPDPVWTAKATWNGNDIGTYAMPALADLDNDGDYDLMIGASGGASIAYKNTGSTSSPTWTAQSSWNLDDVGKNAAPAFGDYLDSDGDLDVQIGDQSYGLTGFQNTGTVSSPAWSSYSAYPVGTGYTTPALADLDNDGDLDMLYGDDNGITYGQKNIGSASSPSWTAEATWNVPSIGSRSSPALADLDGDGDYDLFIGAADGVTYAYKNTGSASSPTWTAQSSWNAPSVGTYAAPAFGDLDGDGDEDLLIGSGNGISYAYENTPLIAYSTSGNLVSSGFDGTASLNYGFLYFNKTTPANTTLQFQLATNNDNSTWTFTGPDGTGSTYYTTDTEGISVSLDQNRYAKYTAYLATTVTTSTPTLSDFAISYVAAPMASSGTPPTITFTTQHETRPRPSGATGVSGGAMMQF